MIPTTISDGERMTMPMNALALPSAAVSRGRIMVIDGNTKTRTVLAALLTLFDCRVEQVGAGEDAWRAIMESPPDLIILNGQSSNLDSAALCAVCKRNPATWRIPIIMLSGGAARGSRLHSTEVEADVYVQYPVDPRELQVCVRLLLQRRRHNNQLERAEDVIFALARAVEAKDAYTEGHLQRMARYATAIGARLGLQGDDLTALRYGALLHDIGKVGIDEAIIRKAGPLTPAEYRTMQQHTIIGERIVQPLQLAIGVAPIVRHHHERWDGRGYPDGLAGEAIPLGARIVAVADAFDAMTTQRPYNQVLSVDAALRRLCSGAQIYWDAQIVAVFVQWLQLTSPSITANGAEQLFPSNPISGARSS